MKGTAKEIVTKIQD